MTKNQFRTDSERFLEAIKGNYKDSTFNEKRRKLSYYSDVLFKLYTDGKISSCNPKTLTKEDIAAYVAFRRSNGIKDSTIRKDLSMIGELLTFVGNDAMDLYKVVYGNKRPKSYNGRLDPLPDEVMEGCMAIILGCAAGLRPQEARQLYASDVHHLEEEPYIHVRHVKGEDSWGRHRSVPLNDGVSDIVEKYMGMRLEKMRARGVVSDAMFPPLRSKKEFVSQQSMSRFKMDVAEIIGSDFVLKDGRRAYGQRMLDRGVPIEYVSYCMGHDSVETTQKYYASYRDKSVLSEVHEILRRGSKT